MKTLFVRCLRLSRFAAGPAVALSLFSGLLLSGPLLSGCGGDDPDTPPSDDLGLSLFFDIPKTELGGGGGDTEGASTLLANDCGQGCAVGEVCAVCFSDAALKCVAPPAGRLGAGCTSDSACVEGRCVMSGDAGRCSAVCDPSGPATCLMRPGLGCKAADTASGEAGTFCLPTVCGEVGGLCGGGLCDCGAGMECRVDAAGNPGCAARCEADPDTCGEGYSCVDGWCDALGLRPMMAPCSADEQCESGRCDLTPTNSGRACLAACNECGHCPRYTNGCGVVQGICQDGACVLTLPPDVGGACGPEISCTEEQGGDGRGDPNAGPGETTGPGPGDDPDASGPPDGEPGRDGPNGPPDASDGPQEGAQKAGADAGVEDVWEGGPDDVVGPDDVGERSADVDPYADDASEPADGAEGALPVELTCVSGLDGPRCAPSCTAQADCEPWQRCRQADRADDVVEAGLYCVPIADDGFGDCCAVTDPCRGGLSCVVDGGALLCSMTCSADSQCPPEYRCLQTPAVSGGGGRHCVQTAPEPEGEICNGQDDDLDGTVDLDAAGESLRVPCYDGPSGTLGVGICAAGFRTCQGGHYGACKGQKRPVQDGPDGPPGCDGFDNDCDGGIDEGCPCIGEVTLCGKVEGECEQGVQLCEGGVMGDCLWGAAPKPIWPTAEVCDGLDNDCDGAIDNAVGGPDYSLERPCGDLDPTLDGVGTCRLGAQACGGPCVGAIGPSEEVCDSQDNDCDGVVDEGCACSADAPRACGVVAGPCGAGAQACEAGIWSAVCAGAGQPSPEVCDGVDNDCDGHPDNIPGTLLPMARSCWSVGADPDALQVGLGVCAVGEQVCIAAVWAGCLEGQTPAVLEVCGDQLDNNCDGAIDEGCDCPKEGQQTLCGVNVGECSVGAQKCVNGKRGACLGAKMPTVESCNGKDDNCDGAIDERSTGEPLQRPCYEGGPGTLGLGGCAMGARMCVEGAYGDCEGTVPSPELCNGLDDDCDGVTDEQYCGCAEGDTRPCGKEGGVCQPGVSVCVDHVWSALCYGSVLPSPEVCDGVDNDCDGTVDVDPVTGEAVQEGCYDGPALTAGFGVCHGGSRQCVNGALTGCLGQKVPLGPNAEPCDGMDNDCDGLVDEFCPCGQAASRACGTDVGLCVAGTQACVGGSWADTCEGAVGPVAETCNGKDDDCDGTVDGTAGRAIAEPCFDGGPDASVTGACAAGVRVCADGQMTGCLGQKSPAVSDACGNGVDDDCDGGTDEGCL